MTAVFKLNEERIQTTQGNNPQDGLHVLHPLPKKIKAREKDNHATEKEHRVKKATYPYLGKNHSCDLPADYHTELILSATERKWNSDRLQYIQLKH